MKGTVREGRETIQVQGGHIIRSTGRKDRHSKVYTLKGPRDRRIRLSAHTAIQFYDVQDRLGYDRPSKAVDWLIQKAKNAIDKLNELNPSWQHPSLDHHVNPATDQPTTDSNPSPKEVPLEQPQSMEPLIKGPSEAHAWSSMRSFFPTRASEELECFHGWNNGGFVANSIPQQEIFFSFSQREILQSNLLAWNHQQSFDQIQGRQSSNFGTPFELGFSVQARIYGDQQESSDGT